MGFKKLQTSIVVQCVEGIIAIPIVLEINQTKEHCLTKLPTHGVRKGDKVGRGCC